MDSTSDEDWKKKYADQKKIQLDGLDDLVAVNSIFTVAVFLGLTLASSPNQPSPENETKCQADAAMGKRAIRYEIISFACFLFSSLAAKSLKTYLNIYYEDKATDDKRSIFSWIFSCIYRCCTCSDWERHKKLNDVTPKISGRALLFASSLLASIVGIVLLTFSVVYIVQIKLGKLHCGSGEATLPVVSLCVIVASGLLLYFISVLDAIIYCWVME
ncbi:uncharacterized protein LOC131179419 [Hevea brasiliensis]|uniref:uncharacterized protein LOC131179419 n=1 Tax=Hevea brasiliensis TaxID=3981 RepID=UPI0025F2006F|nr:uncharacterized protein LOC131179419 [Hevea brasiliensis]